MPSDANHVVVVVIGGGTGGVAGAGGDGSNGGDSLLRGSGRDGERQRLVGFGGGFSGWISDSCLGATSFAAHDASHRRRRGCGQRAPSSEPKVFEHRAGQRWGSARRCCFFTLFLQSHQNCGRKKAAVVLRHDCVAKNPCLLLQSHKPQQRQHALHRIHMYIRRGGDFVSASARAVKGPRSATCPYQA